MVIKELVLKHNMVIPGYPTKFYSGLSIPVTDRDRNDNTLKQYFVSRITFYPEDSSFVTERELSSGCYVVSMAKNSEDFCLGKNSEEEYMIMEDIVAMILF